MDRPEFDLSDADAEAFCPACGAGYTSRRSRCADCDQELLPRSEIETMLAGVDEPEKTPRPEEPAPEGTAGATPEFDLSDPDAVAFCPACGSGFRAGPLRCGDCDRELVPRSFAEAPTSRAAPESTHPDHRVFLADVGNSFKANLLASVLSDEGIRFATEPSPWGAIRFLVLPRDLDAARNLVSDMDENAGTLELPDEG